jgi:hypothetical protein
MDRNLGRVNWKKKYKTKYRVENQMEKGRKGERGRERIG